MVRARQTQGTHHVDVPRKLWPVALASGVGSCGGSVDLQPKVEGDGGRCAGDAILYDRRADGRDAHWVSLPGPKAKLLRPEICADF